MRRSLANLCFSVFAIFQGAALAAEKPPLIGYLSGGIPEVNAHILKAFRTGLQDTGFIDGRNVKILYRWSFRDNSIIEGQVKDLLASKVNVIVASGGQAPIRAALQHVKNIPIVFATGGDPLALGYVDSLSRPSGNVTGSSFYSAGLAAKILQHLKETLPLTQSIVLLLDPRRQDARTNIDQVRKLGSRLKINCDIVLVTSASEIRDKLKISMLKRYDAILTGFSPFLNNSRKVVLAIAEKAKIPVFANTREYPADGALLGYSASREVLFRNVGRYTGRILKGESTSNLPVLLPSIHKLTINLRTAKRLGIAIPPTVLAIADQVIE